METQLYATPLLPAGVQGSIQELVLPSGKHDGKQMKQVSRKLAAEALEEQNTQQGKASPSRKTGMKHKKKRRSVRNLLGDLKACSNTRSLERGRELHAEAIVNGEGANAYVAAALINMYAKCGSLNEAREVFNSMKHPDVVAWSALILGYAENGDAASALDMFAAMKSQDCSPNPFTFVAALKACSSLAQDQYGSPRAEIKDLGKQIHSEIGCHLNMYVQSALIDMYAKFASMAEARQVFNSMKHPDVVSWTALILGYAENGEGFTALDMLARMQSKGCAPNAYTIVAALKACSSLAMQERGTDKAHCLMLGRQIHAEYSSILDIYAQNTLIDMYAKCGSMGEARQVFDSIEHPNVVSWNALITGYADNGEAVTALELFVAMKSRGFVPNEVTFAAVLKASGALGALDFGSKFHAELKILVEEFNGMLVTCLVDFYAKCGNMVQAREIFDSHPRTRDVATWTALLAGYSRLGDSSAVVRLLEGMQDEGIQPNGVTFLCVLTCCSHAGLVEKANEFFQAMSTRFEIAPRVEHYNCMIDILGRSNKVDDAMALLRSMPCKANSVTWTTVLGACRRWKNVGLGSLALETSGYLSKDERNVLGMNDKLKKEPGQSCWTDEMGKAQVFKVHELMALRGEVLVTVEFLRQPQQTIWTSPIS